LQPATRNLQTSLSLSCKSRSRRAAKPDLPFASKIADSVKASRCPDDGWIRYHGQQCKITLQAFDQRLAEAGEKMDSAFAGRLKALRSQLENLAGQFREKTGAATVPPNAI
jgi:hypothetical protein